MVLKTFLVLTILAVLFVQGAVFKLVEKSSDRLFLTTVNLVFIAILVRALLNG